MSQSDERPAAIPYLVWILGGATMLGPLSVDMYLPAMARSLGADPPALQLTITAFLVGFGLGPLLLGPLSDAIGRRAVLIGCVGVFVVASLFCAAASSVEALIAYRVIQALSGGSATTLARTIVHDVHRGDLAARMLSTLMMVLSLALMAAPAIGGQLLHAFGWRSIFILLAAVGAASLIGVVARLPETLPTERRQPLNLAAALRGCGRILSSSAAMSFTLAGAFAGGAMFAYLAATPFIFIEHFGLEPTLYGALFAVNMIGAIAINGLNGRLVPRVGYRRMLGLGALALAANAIGLAAIAATGFGGVAGMALGLFAIVGLSHVMGTNGLTGALEQFRERAGATAASFAACRFAAGALATIAIGAMDQVGPWPLAAVVLSCAAAASLATLAALKGPHRSYLFIVDF
jgi:DHA1 family bicyclomycin/chloramphenicol resistance-like MFS transporter